VIKKRAGYGVGMREWFSIDCGATINELHHCCKTTLYSTRPTHILLSKSGNKTAMFTRVLKQVQDPD